ISARYHRVVIPSWRREHPPASLVPWLLLSSSALTAFPVHPCLRRKRARAPRSPVPGHHLYRSGSSCTAWAKAGPASPMGPCVPDEWLIQDPVDAWWRSRSYLVPALALRAADSFAERPRSPVPTEVPVDPPVSLARSCRTAHWPARSVLRLA